MAVYSFVMSIKINTCTDDYDYCDDDEHNNDKNNEERINIERYR